MNPPSVSRQHADWLSHPEQVAHGECKQYSLAVAGKFRLRNDEPIRHALRLLYTNFTALSIRFAGCFAFGY